MHRPVYSRVDPGGQPGGVGRVGDWTRMYEKPRVDPGGVGRVGDWTRM